MIGESRPLFWGYRITSTGLIIKPDGTFQPQSVSNKGYYQVGLRNLNGAWHGGYLVHRLVAHVFVKNPRPDIFVEVDHIDRDPKNNVFSNLRWLSKKLNLLNTNAKGCYFVKKWNKWRAQLRKKTLGYFETYEEAHEHYLKHRADVFMSEYKQLCDEVVHEPNTRRASLIFFSKTPARCPIPCYS